MLDLTVKYTALLCLITMFSNIYSEEIVPKGSYFIDVEETLNRHIATSQPALSDADRKKRVDASKAAFTKLMSVFSVNDSSVDVLDNMGAVTTTYKATKIKFNEKINATLITDPDEQWKNLPVELLVIKEMDKIIWQETANAISRVFILRLKK